MKNYEKPVIGVTQGSSSDVYNEFGGAFAKAFGFGSPSKIHQTLKTLS